MSIFADILLEWIRSSILLVESENISPALSISAGVFLEALPLPPPTIIPCSSGFIAFFNAPHVVVVVPDECQSNPSTHENA